MVSSELEQRYRGVTAKDYDAVRAGRPKWQREHAAVTRMLSSLPEGSTVLDIPVGTGRFIGLYKELRLQATGADVSSDMLTIASKRAEEAQSDAQMVLANIFRTEFLDEQFDACVCMRFLNWVDINDVEKSLVELRRIARTFLVVGIRSYVPAKDLRLTSPYGLFRFLHQRLWRAFPRLRKGLFVHEHHKVIRMLGRLNLKIIDHVCSDSHRSGTDYDVFLLKKA